MNRIASAAVAALAVLWMSVVSAQAAAPAAAKASAMKEEAKVEKALRAFYTAANDGKYEAALNMLTRETITSLVDKDGTVGGIWSSMCDTNTMDRTITKIEVKKVTVDHGAALVLAKIYFKKAPPRDNDKTILRLEDGTWKVSP